ncbi:amino acid adenylation domain-containing protein [Cognatiyoonia sp. IB215446]|uniref:amino acid adenylation domain-containing protein n=1 Tax=Cognatiyoonia sp. IB215446 TaxID=3097355 RepID=UPI002A0B33DF|nr:amino acid adenylation domain-containing protein [Cognatiyoonia sp. IB215446]MDX8348120.1 amino acid adenylation domain-containing protein [Cognatiyoonia sp. IB215446]
MNVQLARSEHVIPPSLPIAGKRSLAYWPKTMVTSARDSLPSALLPETGHAQLARLAAAIQIVLIRTHRDDDAPVGVVMPVGDIIRIEASNDLQAKVGKLLAEATTKIDESPAQPPVEPKESVNSDFAIAVAPDEQAIPNVRQDATVFFDASEDRLACCHNSRLFDADTVVRFLDHIAGVLRILNDAPDTTVGMINILSQAESDQIAAVTCPDPQPLPEAGTVQALFAEQARTAPNAVAMIFEGQKTTYAELDQQRAAIGVCLRRHGCVKGDRVGVCVPPGPEQIAALLAVLGIGATPVPVDHTFPHQRLSMIAETARPKVFLSADRMRNVVEGFGEIVLMSEAIAESVEDLSVAGDINDAAYLLFTSGSTGRPKGVLVGQRTLVNLIAWQNEQTPATDRRTLNRSSMAFDVGFQEIFATLCYGGTLVISTEAQRADIGALLKILAEQKIHRSFLPPVALLQIAELYDEASDDLSTLEEVIVAGERMTITPPVVKMFRTCPAQLINQYGPTETHVATSHTLSGASVRWPLTPPIGKPIANARIHIVDAAGMRCPIGTTGEIAIGGLLPALEYVDAPEATATKFVPDPFPDAAADGRMYLTGDFGRLLPSGEIEFVGRRDDQVKLRGYRIELGDIEAHACDLPNVGLAATRLQSTGAGDSDTLLCLYLQSTDGAALDLTALRADLAKVLPRHMVPALPAMLQLDDIPLNSNGKIDRLKLPQLELVQSEGDEEATTPRERVRQVWRRHLHVDDISEEAAFADLGGHSLTAIQVVSAVNHGFGISVPVVALLRGATFGQFADVVEDYIRRKGGGESAATPASSGPSLQSTELPKIGRIQTPYPSETRHYYDEIFVNGAYWVGGARIPEGGTVIDVGANVGMFTIFALVNAKARNVFALEPVPLLADAFRANVAPLADKATLVQIAASDKDGRGELTTYPLITGMSSLRPDIAKDSALLTGLLGRARARDAETDTVLAPVEGSLVESRMSSETVPTETRRLASLLEEHGVDRVDLLKVDVQRGEDLVLAGLDDAAWSKIEQVVVEHQEPSGTGGVIAEILASKGFSVTSVQHEMHLGTEVYYTTGRKEP